MKTIGFAISRKKNEKRRALLPPDLFSIQNQDRLFFEQGYGSVLDIPDQAYLDRGVNIVSTKNVYKQDIICLPKIHLCTEKSYFHEGQSLFGWINAVPGREITDFLCQKKMTAIAWEEMYKNGRHCFWRNNEIAGEAAVLHSIIYTGKSPGECKTAIIGMGNCGRGAFKILSQLGAEINVFNRDTIHQLDKNIGKYDIVVNAVKWDLFRKDHLIDENTLQKIKPGAVIVDISCDPGGGIQTSRPTTIDDPVYEINGVFHYAVDHTPALLYRTASKAISSVVKEYIDDLVTENVEKTLQTATVIKNGRIPDGRILRFQKR